MPLIPLANRERMKRLRADPAYREAENERRRTPEYRAKATANRKSITLRRRFVGIDGEGGNINGCHEYLLLRAGNHTLVTGKPLTPDECLAFIADLPTGDTIYVGYFFDYDVTMILRDWPEERIRRLVNREARTVTKGGKTYTYAVDYGGYQVDYIPRKEFKVRRVLPGKDGKNTYSKWVSVNDVGSFFQCSFVKALTEWDIGTAEQRDAIADGKDRRADFGQLDADTDEYNALEIDLLQQLMTAFRQVCTDVGYTPARWQGPGYLATAMLKRHGVPTRKQIDVPAGLIEYANGAYYGGRFETTAIGPVNGGCYQYDINSAYPAAMLELPCLIHGTWERRKLSAIRPGELWVGKLHFWAHEDANLYSFPVRDPKGSICFPAEGNGIYWSVEAVNAPHQSYGASAPVWVYVPHCDCRPFDWIEPIYEERKRLGKTAKGRVLKLALNSLYGKQAQSVGAAPYANPIYAGLITALTRGDTLSSATHTGPDCCRDVYMLATDAVFTGKPRHLAISKQLGDWDSERHEELFLVQPGLYFTEANSVPKTRGIPRQAAVDKREDFTTAYRLMCVGGNPSQETVSIQLRQFTGLRIAVARGKIRSAGVWAEVTKEISFEWITKRHEQRTEFEGPLRTLRTHPKDGAYDLVSMPYSKDIGRMLEQARLELSDQPDWADVPFGEDL